MSRPTPVPRVSIRYLIQNAPHVLALRKVLDATREIRAKSAPNTIMQWENETAKRAYDFVHDAPGQGFWVYNTLFTYLRDDQRVQLLETTKKKYARWLLNPN